MNWVCKRTTFSKILPNFYFSHNLFLRFLWGFLIFFNFFLHQRVNSNNKNFHAKKIFYFVTSTNIIMIESLWKIVFFFLSFLLSLFLSSSLPSFFSSCLLSSFLFFLIYCFFFWFFIKTFLLEFFDARFKILFLGMVLVLIPNSEFWFQLRLSFKFKILSLVLVFISCSVIKVLGLVVVLIPRAEF